MHHHPDSPTISPVGEGASKYRRQQIKARTAARWNGALLVATSPVLLLVGLSRAGTSLEFVYSALAAGLWLVVGVLAVRWGRWTPAKQRPDRR